MVYGLASRGFKSGGYNIRAQRHGGAELGRAVRRRGQVDSFEIGSKMAFLDQTPVPEPGRLPQQLRGHPAVGVHADAADGSASFFGDFTNAGEGTVNGFEVEYQWLPSANWLISGNLAWLDAKYDEFLFFDPLSQQTIDIADEQEFTNAPEFSGALNVEYRTDLANGGNLSARVGYSYQSEVVATTEIAP